MFYVKVLYAHLHVGNIKLATMRHTRVCRIVAIKSLSLTKQNNLNYRKAFTGRRWAQDSLKYSDDLGPTLKTCVVQCETHALYI